MSTDKKPWIRPQLIVLGRGNPEERVLAACKQAAETGPDSVDCLKTGGGKCSGIGQS
jgi:hypothetical protein